MILSIIFLTGILSDRGLPPAYALGLGVVTGGFFQFFFQFFFVLSKGFGPTGPIRIFSHGSRKILKNLGLGAIGTGATQINILVATILATGTQTGAVSWLAYAFRLFLFPVGILGVSIAGSNLVHFSNAWKAGQNHKARNILQSSYHLSWMLLIPSTILLFEMAGPAVKLVFERGKFDVSDTLKTSDALKAYVLGLPFYGLYKVFGPTFFSINRPKIPIFISMGCVLFNIVFCFFFVSRYGYVVLALGTSLSIFLNVLLQIFFLKKRLGLHYAFFFNKRIFKYLLAGLACFLTVHFLEDRLLGGEAAFFPFLLSFIFTGTIAAAVYLILLFVLGEI